MAQSWLNLLRDRGCFLVTNEGKTILSTFDERKVRSFLHKLGLSGANILAQLETFGNLVVPLPFEPEKEEE